MNGFVAGLCISPKAGDPMQYVEKVEAIAGVGLKGDRYATGEGSYNKGVPGRRQVTLINGQFFAGTPFEYKDSRRNIITLNIELMWLIGREFRVGAALFRGVKYCDPCLRPSKLSGKPESFQKHFFDRGGLVAEVLESGLIEVGQAVVPPKKDY